MLDRVAAARSSRSIARADPVSLEEFGLLLATGNGAATRSKAGVTVGPKQIGRASWR